MRVFAALRAPQHVTEHLVRALRPIREDNPTDLRWVDPDSWHITTSFYGSQPDGAVDDLLEHVKKAAEGFSQFTVNVKGAGSFNQSNLWMGIGGETRDLRELMAQCLLDPEERTRQRPHLTVARASRSSRINRWDPVLPDLVRALSVYEGPEWHVQSVELIQSHLGQGRSGGPRYETLGTIHLGR